MIISGGIWVITATTHTCMAKLMVFLRDGKLRIIHRKTKPESGSNISVQNVGSAWSAGPNRPAAAAARTDSESQTMFFCLETVPFTPILDETPMRDMAPAISDDE